MKMQMWIYQTKNTPIKGFCIQEHKKENKFTVWCDPNEGGYAHDSDWEYCDKYPDYPVDDFTSYDESLKWIFDNYGDVIDIDNVEE
jgi:hypothetical protein